MDSYKTLILDRDGVLNKHSDDYILNCSQLKLIEGSISTINEKELDDSRLYFCAHKITEIATCFQLTNIKVIYWLL